MAAGSELVHGLPTWDWRGLTFRAVAERAGVGERTVYHHFPTERHLRDAVMVRLEEEAGVAYDDLTLDELAGATARSSPRCGRSPWRRAPRGRTTRRSRTRTSGGGVPLRCPRPVGPRVVRRAARTAAALLDVLWNLPTYERLVGAWRFDADRATGAVLWLIDHIVAAVDAGEPRSAARSDGPLTPGGGGDLGRAPGEGAHEGRDVRIVGTGGGQGGGGRRDAGQDDEQVDGRAPSRRWPRRRRRRPTSRRSPAAVTRSGPGRPAASRPREHVGNRPVDEVHEWRMRSVGSRRTPRPSVMSPVWIHVSRDAGRGQAAGRHLPTTHRTRADGSAWSKAATMSRALRSTASDLGAGGTALGRHGLVGDGVDVVAAHRPPERRDGADQVVPQAGHRRLVGLGQVQQDVGDRPALGGGRRRRAGVVEPADHRPQLLDLVGQGRHHVVHRPDANGGRCVVGARRRP